MYNENLKYKKTFFKRTIHIKIAFIEQLWRNADISPLFQRVLIDIYIYLGERYIYIELQVINGIELN